MARVGSPKDFWNTLKSVSIAQIEREAYRPIHIALVGSESAQQVATEALFTLEESDLGAEAIPALNGQPPYLQLFDDFATLQRLAPDPGAFDFAIDLGADRIHAPDHLRVYTVADLGGWETTLDRLFEDRPDLTLSLARHFPAFRRRAAQHIISQTATANAQFSLLTGVTAAFPILSILLPVSGVSDVVLLTKNQIMMVLRLAAIYGLPLDYRSRVKELAPILGNAVGWRSVARQLIGLIPIGGFLVKASIAYAGTVTVGKAAQFYYETGERVTPADLKRLYQDAYNASREKVRALAQQTRRRPALTSREETLELEATPEPLLLPADLPEERAKSED